jgi:hypothetical protein
MTAGYDIFTAIVDRVFEVGQREYESPQLDTRTWSHLGKEAAYGQIGVCGKYANCEVN